ncbi:MAG: hypothetical protein JO036_14690 [Candidatus Eremiobacteraeota bacterium]|nr:hypothetical protein [Candidatus Eremiobacteraeota bacterium]
MTAFTRASPQPSARAQSAVPALNTTPLPPKNATFPPSSTNVSTRARFSRVQYSSWPNVQSSA